MKTINVNQLQAEISKTLKEVQKGESFEILRYSQPVAALLSWQDYQDLISQIDCKQCITELRKLARRK